MKPIELIEYIKKVTPYGVCDLTNGEIFKCEDLEVIAFFLIPINQQHQYHQDMILNPLMNRFNSWSKSYQFKRVSDALPIYTNQQKTRIYMEKEESIKRKKFLAECETKKETPKS